MGVVKCSEALSVLCQPAYEMVCAAKWAYVECNFESNVLNRDLSEGKILVCRVTCTLLAIICNWYSPRIAFSLVHFLDVRICYPAKQLNQDIYRALLERSKCQELADL